MAKAPKENIDPRDIFLHADGFYKAEEILSNLDLDRNPQLALEVSQAAIVLSSLNSELFLKCLVCIETGKVPSGHHLDYLFNQLSETTRDRIRKIWDEELVPYRKVIWDKMERDLGEGRKLARDLPSALAAGSRAFEKIRYSYESESKDTEFYISDLSQILGRVILEMKPEWARIRRRVVEVQ